MKIEIKNLVKKYGEFKALDDLNLTLENGIYGLLGPNGAGKSTLISILTDSIKRTSGEVLCDGEEICHMGKAYRKRLGYMPQVQSCYDFFSVQEFIEYMAVMKGLQRKKTYFSQEVEWAIREVNLYDKRRLKVGALSGGMKRRVLLAQAMLGNPSLLILDEPTAGLDPKERVSLRTTISNNSKERIVLIATHIVSDIESIADKIILINNGKILACDSPDNLMKEIGLESRQDLENLYMNYFEK